MSKHNPENPNGGLAFKKHLSPKGDDILDDCQTRLWALKSEIAGLSGLLRNVASCDFSSEEFMGLGLSLERFGKRLDKISNKLSRVIES